MTGSDVDGDGEAAVQQDVQDFVKKAIAESESAANARQRQLEEQVSQLQNELARLQETEGIEQEFIDAMGVLPEKGTAAEKELVFPRHYAKINELPRAPHNRRGAERLDVGERPSVKGFLHAGRLHQVQEVEVLVSVESYLQDMYFASVDTTVDRLDFRIEVVAALSGVIGLVRRRRQLLEIEGRAFLPSASLHDRAAAKSLRNLWQSETSSRAITDETLKGQLKKMGEELIKAEAKSVATASGRKKIPPKDKKKPPKTAESEAGAA